MSEHVADNKGKELLKNEIKELKRLKNAVILAHYSVDGDIQDIADYVGDSLALARQAADTAQNGEIVVMCGVNFMGETAKLLCPHNTGLVRDSTSG